MAAIPMAGIAGMKNVTVTCAPLTGIPAAPVSFTRNVLLPGCGVGGFDEYSSDTCRVGAFIAEAAPAPGGGGANDPMAACSWLSESSRKFAEVAIRSPAL